MINKHLVAILALPVLLAAQISKSQVLLMAMAANGKQMAAYQWKQRITVVRKGTPAATIVEELHIDATGQLQRMTLSKPEAKRMGPLRARKVAEVKDDVEDVMRLASRYGSPQQLSQAIQKGEIWEGPGTLRVQARYLIVPTDEMTMVVNAASHLATRMDVKTEYEASPVTISMDYQQLPNGPNMMSRMTVQLPKDDIVVNVEAFDFVRLASF